MADRLISIDTAQAAGEQLPVPVREEIRWVSRERINLGDYADVDDPDTHQAGFEAAIEAAIAAGGAEIIVPPGEWFADGLEIPPQTPLKISGHVADSFPNNQEVVGGSSGSRITRVRDLPIFSMVGASDVLPAYDWQGFARNFTLEDISLRTPGPPATWTEPMFYTRGAFVIRMNRVEFFGGSSYGFSLIDAQGTWDSRFQDCIFGSGGDNDTELPAIWFRSGDETGVDGYNGCNSIVMVNCASNEYHGPAIQYGSDTPDTPSGVSVCSLVSHKMDSVTCTTSHLVATRIAGLFLSNSWISHTATAGPVFDIRRGHGIYGDIAINLTGLSGAVVPSECVKVGSLAYNIQLDVNVMASAIDADDNVVTIGTESPNINISINGASQRVNGKAPQRWVYAHTVGQVAYDENGVCQYVFRKEGLNQWAIGNPSNPSGTVQRMEVRAVDASANVGTFLSLDSADTNPSTSQRSVRVWGDLSVDDDLTVGGVPVVTTTGTQTLSGKTLTSPKIETIYVGGTLVAQFAAPSSGTYLYFSSSSSNPSIQVIGSPTDINVNIVPKGAGTLSIYSGTGVTPTVEARGVDTNHDLRLLPKGSGIVRSGTDPVGVKVAVPANATAVGKPGQWAADASFIYAYTGDGSTHSWVRSAAAAW